MQKKKNYSKDMIDLLALRVTADFQNKIQDGKVTVEDIQDSVGECSDPRRIVSRCASIYPLS